MFLLIALVSNVKTNQRTFRLLSVNYFTDYRFKISVVFEFVGTNSLSMNEQTNVLGNWTNTIDTYSVSIQMKKKRQNSSLGYCFSFYYQLYHLLERIHQVTCFFADRLSVPEPLQILSMSKS